MERSVSYTSTYLGYVLIIFSGFPIVTIIVNF